MSRAPLTAVRRALRVGRRGGGTLFATLAAIGEGRRTPSPAVAAARFQSITRALAALHGVRLERRGELPDGPCVLVANHVSWLDAIVLGQLAPCAPIAKGEVAGWPVIGAGGRALGVSFVDRSSPMSGAVALRRALRVLGAGASVLNFPEGTTTDGTRLLPFRRGVFGVARLAGAPIVPIALSYASPAIAWTGGASFAPHYVQTAARDEIVARVTFGSPILPWPRDSARILAAAARHEIAALLGLPSWTASTGGSHDPADRVRVPAARPDAVLPPAERRLRALP